MESRQKTKLVWPAALSVLDDALQERGLTRMPRMGALGWAVRMAWLERDEELRTLARAADKGWRSATAAERLRWYLHPDLVDAIMELVEEEEGEAFTGAGIVEISLLLNLEPPRLEARDQWAPVFVGVEAERGPMPPPFEGEANPARWAYLTRTWAPWFPLRDADAWTVKLNDRMRAALMAAETVRANTLRRMEEALEKWADGRSIMSPKPRQMRYVVELDEQGRPRVEDCARLIEDEKTAAMLLERHTRWWARVLASVVKNALGMSLWLQVNPALDKVPTVIVENKGELPCISYGETPSRRGSFAVPLTEIAWQTADRMRVRVLDEIERLRHYLKQIDPVSLGEAMSCKAAYREELNAYTRRAYARWETGTHPFGPRRDRWLEDLQAASTLDAFDLADNATRSQFYDIVSRLRSVGLDGLVEWTLAEERRTFLQGAIMGAEGEGRTLTWFDTKEPVAPSLSAPLPQLHPWRTW